MNFQFYVEKLKSSENYKKFLKENPKTYPCSGFFVIDKDGKDNKQHFDFFLPKKKEIFSFQLEQGNLVPIETIDKRIPEKISLDINFDFKEIEKIIENKMQEQSIKNKIQKFLFSFQKKDNKHFLIGTIFVSMLGIIKIQIEVPGKKIIAFEKKSFFDMLKIMKKKG